MATDGELRITETWYFTFGFSHAFPRGYMKITGTFHTARNKMIEKFGTKWSMQYSEEQFAGQVEKYGLHEVPYED